MTRLRTASALLALLALAGSLGACSGSDDAGDAATGGGPASASDEAPAEDAGADSGESGGGSGTTSRVAGASGSVVPPVPARRKVIATATVSLRAPDVREARNEVQRVADVLRGEVGDEETASDDGTLVWTRLVLRVPTEKFGDAVTRLEGIGELQSTERDTEDVTTQVIDNEVRIRAQERSLRRVEVLLDRAERLADIVAVESELTRRQAELDSLKQQQAWLADQTSMSTITVHIDRAGAEEPPDTDEAGFLAGLRAGWDSLSGTAVALATVAGALLPWLVVLALFGPPLLWLVRRAQRGARRPAEPSQLSG